MVGEAYAHVQGESLKAYAAPLTEGFLTPRSPVEGTRVLTLIGLTLMFAGLTSALGIPRAVRAWRVNRGKAVAILPVATHLVMTAWFLSAGVWALFVRVRVG